MTMFPIVARELRVLSKKGWSYWSRLLFAGLAIGGSAFFLFSMQHISPSEVSGGMFGFLAVITFLFCWMSGVWVTSDCLSGEKRNNTLGLLFLTDLKGYDVVLGKMAATSLHSVYGVASVFPVLAIPLLMGGVVFAEFCRVMLAIFLTLLLSLSVGIGVSSMSRSSVRAAAGVFLTMGVLCGAGPALSLFLNISRKVGFLNWMEHWLLVPSIGFALAVSWELPYTRFSGEYWVSIGVNAGLVVGALALACGVVQRTWRESDSVFERFWRRKIGERRRGKQKRQRQLADGQNPVFWLESRQAGKPWLAMLVFVSGGLYWLWGCLYFGWDFAHEANLMVTVFMMQLIIKCHLGVEAARRFGEDRQSGALELLLATPVRVREILRGQMQSFYWQFLGPALVLLFLWLVVLVAPLLHWDGDGLLGGTGMSRDWGKMSLWGLFVLGMIFFLFLDSYALCWLGMWKGLNARFVSRGILANLLTVLLLPSLLVVVIMYLTIRYSRIEGYFLWASWFLIGIVSSSGWLYWGHRQLTTKLRAVAAGDKWG